jgi:hypothetical protein
MNSGGQEEGIDSLQEPAKTKPTKWKWSMEHDFIVVITGLNFWTWTTTSLVTPRALLNPWIIFKHRIPCNSQKTPRQIII